MNGWMPAAEQIQGITNFSPGGEPKVGFCDHTAGGFYSTLRRAEFWNEQGYSVHFCVARDGRICQLVSIFDRAWGQGRLGPTVSWPPYQDMDQRNPNEYLISIEHEDYVLVNGKAKAVSGSEWTEAEYLSDLRIKRWCIEQIPELMKFGIDSLSGHYMFDSVNRKNCPGKFWQEQYRERLFQDLTGEDMYVPANGVANPSYWEASGGREVSKEGVWCGAWFDFPVVKEALSKFIRIQVWTNSGDVVARHGTNNLDAGRTHNRYGVMDVYLNDDGNFWFSPAYGDSARIGRIALLGYWK